MTPRKPISRMSPRRKREASRHPAIRKAFLDRHTTCVKCLKVIPRHERTLHHFYGRIHQLLNWVPGFRMACWTCHDWIEHHRNEAVERGLRAPDNLFNRPSVVIL